MEFAILRANSFLMKNLLLLLLLSFSLPAAATLADTSAYQTQRLKVNALLKQRSAKFGQYDLSLDNRTGIFGMQTKDDIKNSNEILRQIVLNDNNIFKELKVLMDYKDQELSTAKSSLNALNTNSAGYQATIKKLQDENEQLKSTTIQRTSIAWYIVAALGIALVIVLIRSKKNLKSK